MLNLNYRDQKQIKYLILGGNRAMREMLEEYNIPLTTALDLKYKLKAVEYYRKKVKVC